MKRSVVVALAVLGLALLLVGTANAAPTGAKFHHAVTLAQVAQAAPTVTPASTSSVMPPPVVTSTKTDHKSL